jgi:hypothetical protein
MQMMHFFLGTRQQSHRKMAACALRCFVLDPYTLTHPHPHTLCGSARCGCAAICSCLVGSRGAAGFHVKAGVLDCVGLCWIVYLLEQPQYGAV